jgi:hypothetical protein
LSARLPVHGDVAVFIVAILSRFELLDGVSHELHENITHKSLWGRKGEEEVSPETKVTELVQGKGIWWARGANTFIE